VEGCSGDRRSSLLPHPLLRRLIQHPQPPNKAPPPPQPTNPPHILQTGQNLHTHTVNTTAPHPQRVDTPTTTAAFSNRLLTSPPTRSEPTTHNICCQTSHPPRQAAVHSTHTPTH